MNGQDRGTLQDKYIQTRVTSFLSIAGPIDGNGAARRRHGGVEVSPDSDPAELKKILIKVVARRPVFNTDKMSLGSSIIR